MVQPEVTDDVAVKPPEGFNIDDYSKPIFDMYEGHERLAVKLEVRNDLAKYIADRFGTKLETRQISDDRFEVTVEVSLSPTFYAWIFQFGGEIRILSPVKAVAEETVIAAIKNYSQYKDKDLHNLGRYAEMFKVSKQVRQYVEVLLQNVMFERFLERLSKSEYQDKFVIKGGMLISAIVGLDTRITMDLEDDVSFRVNSVAPIRKDDDYGGYRVKMDVIFEQIITPLSIDASTGDVITPDAVEYEFGSIMNDNPKIKLWGYSIETVLAEKIETILSRSVSNTRPRDFYDMLSTCSAGT